MKKFIGAVCVTVFLSASAMALPCYDMWIDCKGGEGQPNTEFCEGMWQGCMKALYDYDAQ
ncbi:MAG: hypothetical protein QNK37_28280 [Acidobacteriota bacterium]|nr:hypothetical protein [Acidobacteriota bacterium]